MFAGGAKSGGGTMRLAICGIAIVAAFVVGGCSQPPSHSDAWLSWKYVPGVGCGDYFSCAGLTDDSGPNDAEAFVYYCTIGIDPADCAKFSLPTLTLDQWKSQNSFATSGIPYAEAVYANLGDLRIGRDMNCWRFGPNNQNVACFVTNYGPVPSTCATGDRGRLCFNSQGWPKIDSALQDAINGNHPFATVAMVYNPGGIGANGDKIAFYTFGAPDANGVQSLIPAAALDEEGPKTVPRMCMACHGGTYDSTAHKVTGTSFLPFDVFYFRYSKTPLFTYDDEQDAFRALNEMVLATNPPQATAEYINGIYPNGIHNAGSPAVDGFVPANWSANPDLYNGVVRQYCRMCHFAQPEPFVNNYADFQNSADLIQALVCSSHDMPHAEVPYGGLPYVGGFSSENPLYKVGFWWDGAAQRDLGNFLNAQGVTNSCLPHD